jgi:hypothetical protein
MKNRDREEGCYVIHAVNHDPHVGIAERPPCTLPAITVRNLHHDDDRTKSLLGLGSNIKYGKSMDICIDRIANNITETYHAK